MLSIEFDKTTQSSDDVCRSVLDLVLITTVVFGTVQSKSLLANGTQTNFRAQSNELLAILRTSNRKVNSPTYNYVKVHCS